MNSETLLPTLLLVAWLAPLAACAVAAVTGSVLARGRGFVPADAARAIAQVTTGASGVSLLASVGALGAWLAARPLGSGTAVPVVGEWFGFLDVGPLHAAVGYYVDALTVVMAALVSLVACCVHVYALGYLSDEVEHDGPAAVTDAQVPTYYGDPVRRAGRLHRFYQHLSLFLFAMLGLVVAGNALMTFVFWELVGATSYLLIGFYYEREEAGAAATKAMLFNRVGDAGMLIGLMALWALAGTFDYDALLDAAPGWLGSAGPERTLALVAGGGLVAGCFAKSAQAPLQGWLPDAMAGPTPVSALVHSATMVAAGVFLLGRVYPLLAVEVLAVVACVGAVTLLLGAAIASASNDLKRVLAYSTVSQLGYMTLAMGVGGWGAALFHLVTHAGFKALLFLGAGGVIHATHTGDLRLLGGLRRKMPATALLMLVGLLALVGAGVPGVGIGLAGFYSKDAIFEHALAFSRANPSWAWLCWAPLLGAVLTASYITRLWLLLFVGEPRSSGAAHAHEAPGTMLLPMAVVAAIAVGGGWSVPATGLSVAAVLSASEPAVAHARREARPFGRYVIPAAEAAHDPEVRRSAGWLAIAATLVGASSALLMHHGGRKCETAAGPFLRSLDRAWIPSVSRGVESAARRLGGAVAGRLDGVAIEGALAGAARGVAVAGGVLRATQTGRLRQYVVLLALGVALAGAASLRAVYAWSAGS